MIAPLLQHRQLQQNQKALMGAQDQGHTFNYHRIGSDQPGLSVPSALLLANCGPEMT
ncbi:hypothetical protein H8F27_15900 [Synechococcus sp. CBW1108]|nr:hypothetical protein H8F27_15900 [Synechococcus sp. CBW1108]